MRQVQLNLVKDKLTNSKGEKFVYVGFFNQVAKMYYVFNNEKPHKLLALSELEVENVKNNIIDGYLNFGKLVAVLDEFEKATKQLKSARLTKKEFETTASILCANEDNLNIEELVLEYVKLSKNLGFYKHALTQIPLLKEHIEKQQKELIPLVREFITIPTRDEYLEMLLEGTTAVVTDNVLSLKLPLKGSLPKIMLALEEVEWNLLFGTLDTYINIKGSLGNPSITYELTTDLLEKFTLSYAKEMNTEMKDAIKQLSDFIVKTKKGVNV